MVATVPFRAALSASLLPVCTAAVAGDACRASLPDALVAQLERHNPGFRAPQATDNHAVDATAHRAAGGNGCLGVTSADFDGDGSLDYAVALSGHDNAAGRVMVALRSGSRWQLHKLMDWTTGRPRLYVDAVAPGVHHRFSGPEPPIAPLDRARGERATMTCKQPGVMLGATEASGTVFCLIGGAWHHVWISD